MSRTTSIAPAAPSTLTKAAVLPTVTRTGSDTCVGELVRVRGVLRLFGNDGRVYELDADTRAVDQLDPGCLPTSAPTPAGRVAVIGAGLLGRCVAAALAEQGVDLLLCDTGRPDLRVLPGTSRPSAGEALGQWLAVTGRAGPDQVRVGEHWTRVDQFEAVSVAVVAGPQLVADRAVTTQLLRHGITHLTAVQHAWHAAVSSVTIPGRTACQCCRDLTLADVDPLWPLTVEALGSRAARPDLGLCAWSGQQVARSLAGHWAGLVASTQTEAFADGRTRRAHWPTHPDCPCQLGAA